MSWDFFQPAPMGGEEKPGTFAGAPRSEVIDGGDDERSDDRGKRLKPWVSRDSRVKSGGSLRRKRPMERGEGKG